MYVYLIQSIENPSKRYIGHTVNLKQWLETHNSGGSKFTKPYRPWKLVAYFALTELLLLGFIVLLYEDRFL